MGVHFMLFSVIFKCGILFGEAAGAETLSIYSPSFEAVFVVILLIHAECVIPAKHIHHQSCQNLIIIKSVVHYSHSEGHFELVGHALLVQPSKDTFAPHSHTDVFILPCEQRVFHFVQKSPEKPLQCVDNKAACDCHTDQWKQLTHHDMLVISSQIDQYDQPVLAYVLQKWFQRVKNFIYKRSGDSRIGHISCSGDELKVVGRAKSEAIPDYVHQN
ncbi:hypothetical protein BLNAU_14715 [Blattamonas nauphoetae]|uniref:Uncharacterized protein n=1 Tax=Blattamonas nauphoetae TaxID=2049346 RepID=A0ABQ9XJP5_9EUKA|nr:hypothetical protein BLNAU_14715 [Blattamonas nauphoetae]